MKKNIVIINGSLRKGSFNQVLLNYVKEKLEEKGVEVKQVKYDTIPYMNQDIEFPTPDLIASIRQEVAQANGVWIATPEYNGSIPGTIKNLLDWLSRPVAQGEYGPPALIKDKNIAICGAGAVGAHGAIDELKRVLGRMAANPLDLVTGIALPKSAFETGVFELSEENKKNLDIQIEAVLKVL